MKGITNLIQLGMFDCMPQRQYVRVVWFDRKLQQPNILQIIFPYWGWFGIEFLCWCIVWTSLWQASMRSYGLRRPKHPDFKIRILSSRCSRLHQCWWVGPSAAVTLHRWVAMISIPSLAEAELAVRVTAACFKVVSRHLDPLPPPPRN
jgi:hypothetical protein